MWKLILKSGTNSFLKNKKRKRNIKLRKAIKAAQNRSKGLENMIVYVDDNGRLTSTPPSFPENN